MVSKSVLCKVETIFRETVLEKKTNESALQKLLQKQNAQKQPKANTTEEEQSNKGEGNIFRVIVEFKMHV